MRGCIVETMSEQGVQQLRKEMREIEGGAGLGAGNEHRTSRTAFAIARSFFMTLSITVLSASRGLPFRLQRI